MGVKLFSKENFCDNCNSKLSSHYTPIKTKRYIKTFKCNKCGLIQSIPQSYFKSHPKPSMSVDADRSSIMYTKKRFLPRNIKLFRKFKINFNKFENILDIGANRGSFVQYVRSKNKKVKIFAVESKKKIFDYKKYKKTEFSNTRFEDAVIQSDTYDFIYCVHTLEHFVSSKLALLKMFNCLKVGGKAFIVVPNMNFYSNKSIVEYFIDTHTFHFTNNSLVELFNRVGLRIIKKDESSDLTYYLEKSLSKNIKKKNNYFRSKNGFFDHKNSMLKYKNNLIKNRKKLKNFGKKLKNLNKEILFWGAGRIFDGLFKYGNIKKNSRFKLYDKFLGSYFKGFFGLDIISEKKLVNLRDYLIIICSESESSDIKKEAKKYGFKRYIAYNKLL